MGAEESSRVIPTTWKSAMLKILTFKSLWFNRLACTPQVRHPVLGWKPYPSIQKKRTSFWEGAHHGNQSTWQVFSQACWGLEMDHVFWNYAYTLLTQSLKCDIPPVRKPSQKGRLWKKKITEGTWSMPHMELKKKTCFDKHLLISPTLSILKMSKYRVQYLLCTLTFKSQKS